MTKFNQSKPHKTHPVLFAHLCKALSSRVAKRQLRKAILNYAPKYGWDKGPSDIADICGSFIWESTPQGHSYWESLGDKIREAKNVQA